MPKPPIFACDLDGVLLDMADFWNEYLSKKYGKRVTTQDQTSWDIRDWSGIPSLNKFWDATWEADIWPYPGAASFVHSLQKLGYEVRIVSSRGSENALKAGYRQLAKYFPMLSGHIFVDGEKGPALAALQPSVFLDDRPKNLFDCALVCPRTRLFLMDRPWNQSLELDAPWRRVGGYAAILSALAEPKTAVRT